MLINSDTLISIKSEIERLTKIDKHITDVIVTIQLTEKKDSDKNFMFLTLKNQTNEIQNKRQTTSNKLV